nr:VOC family protein [Corynebacterium lactis]
MAIEFFPYISFRGNGRKAFAYYQSIFGGDLHLESYPEVAQGEDNPFPFTPPKDALAHGLLDAGAVRITGGDGIGESLPSLESNVYSFMLQCETVAEAEELIAKFLESGSTVLMPFMKAPWGSHYGQVKDPFGVMWAFHAE